jgi:hypothetical protein
LLADRLMCSWTEMFLLKRRGVDIGSSATAAHAGGAAVSNSQYTKGQGITLPVH